MAGPYTPRYGGPPTQCQLQPMMGSDGNVHYEMVNGVHGHRLQPLQPSTVIVTNSSQHPQATTTTTTTTTHHGPSAHGAAVPAMNINNISNTNNHQVITFINNTAAAPGPLPPASPQKVFVFQHHHQRPPLPPPPSHSGVQDVAQCIASKPATRSPADSMLIDRRTLPQQQAMDGRDGERAADRKMNIFGADLPALTALPPADCVVATKLEDHNETKPKLEALSESQSSSRNEDGNGKTLDDDGVPHEDRLSGPDPVRDGEGDGRRPLKRRRPSLPRLWSAEEVAAKHGDSGHSQMLPHLKRFCGAERLCLGQSFGAMFCDKWWWMELCDDVVDLPSPSTASGHGHGRRGDGDGDAEGDGDGECSNLKYHQCGECGKKYKYLCNLRSHSKVHTAEAHVCEFCQKRFGRKANYEEHRRVHTGESPYRCQFCKRSFKQRHGLKDHMRLRCISNGCTSPSAAMAASGRPAVRSSVAVHCDGDGNGNGNGNGDGNVNGAGSKMAE